MPQHHLNPWAQQVAPKGFPREGAQRPRDLLLPPLLPCELGPAPGAGRWGGSRAFGGGAECWQGFGGESSPTEPGAGVPSPPPRLPALPTVAQRAPNRTALRSPLLPPLLLARVPRTPAPPRPGPREGEDWWSGSAREALSSSGALREASLPSRFQEFLRQLGDEWLEQPQPLSEAILGSLGGGARAGLSHFRCVGGRRPTLHRRMLLLVKSWQAPLESQSTTAASAGMRKLRPKPI